MTFDRELNQILEWANIVAEEHKISALAVLITFDRSYKEVKDVNKARNRVEKEGVNCGTYG